MAKPTKPAVPKVAGGPLHAVVCPHCGHPNDFRELLIAGGETTIYNGAEISCDKCDMISVITKVMPITLIQWRPTGKKAEVERRGGPLARR